MFKSFVNAVHKGLPGDAQALRLLSGCTSKPTRYSLPNHRVLPLTYGCSIALFIVSCVYEKRAHDVFCCRLGLQECVSCGRNSVKRGQARHIKFRVPVGLPLLILEDIPAISSLLAYLVPPFHPPSTLQPIIAL